ncbi:hypothetical protein QMA77_20225 [Pantoea ananatis]|uniref:hypothetical protein n=1 Tax=Pantoea ananas TaxID=553 RepID=UPI001B3145DF|nr:hypothetical protein [Pantoea ananatis]MDI6539254.1 hypothetical protein [Pantoea ananatis]UYL03007.1 hypothetical protein NG830_06645 [Pantoea ananatis]
MSNSDKVMKDGKMLHGNAATLHLASLGGGMDKYMQDKLDAAAIGGGRAAVAEYERLQKAPKLKVVKGGKK